MACVFASSNFKYLGDLHMNEDWVAKIGFLSSEMNDFGDYGGLIILDQKNNGRYFRKPLLKRAC